MDGSASGKTKAIQRSTIASFLSKSSCMHAQRTGPLAAPPSSPGINRSAIENSARQMPLLPVASATSARAPSALAPAARPSMPVWEESEWVAEVENLYRVSLRDCGNLRKIASVHACYRNGILECGVGQSAIIDRRGEARGHPAKMPPHTPPSLSFSSRSPGVLGTAEIFDEIDTLYQSNPPAEPASALGHLQLEVLSRSIKNACGWHASPFGIGSGCPRHTVLEGHDLAAFAQTELTRSALAP